ncbi:MAG: GNAT family N-acetyltransferase [Phycisphaeraceae bacterium]|nr:GNAT family N-acetyltransferase [Phycisphaeraceae bacterium]
MTFTFRTAAAEDFEPLLAMMADLYRSMNCPFDLPATRRALGELWGDASAGRVEMILADGRTAGYLVVAFGFSLEFGGRFAVVDELYVRPEFRDRGLGTAALGQARKVAEQAGVGAMRLEVEENNPKARALYERMGFIGHKRNPMTLRLN